MRDSLAGLDLNLIVSLNAILEEKSVSKAASKLHVSQPTMSVALRRLRTMYDDEILTRHGNSYELTPLATELSLRTTIAMHSVLDVFTAPHRFDPASSTREFTVAGNDHTAATIGVRACELAQAEAPGVAFRFINAATTALSPSLTDLERCDVALLPPNLFPDAEHAEIFDDHWVILASADNERATEGVTLELMDSLPWVVTAQSRDAPRPAFAQLRMLGISPTVVAAVDSFLALPAFISGTDRLALVPSQLAEVLVQSDHSLQWRPCPYEASGMTITMYWHPRNATDPAQLWMRQIISTAARSVSEGVGRPARARP